MNKALRWFRSKTGKQTLVGLLAVLIIVAVAGELVGWWDLIPGVGTPVVGQYHCMPSCDDGIPTSEGGSGLPQDGKFLSMPGEDMASFGGESAIIWVEVDPDKTFFELGIFDGDSGRDNTGAINKNGGNWDNTQTETTYTLYTDRLKDGATTDDVMIGQWKSNSPNPTSGTGWTASSDIMQNNKWYNLTINRDTRAQAPSGYYFYRFEASRPIQGTGINAFKLRATGTLASGQADVANVNFAIVGMLGNMNDVRILYPQFTGNILSPGPSNYTGDWQFYFTVPSRTLEMALWNGDFDRGPLPVSTDDSDDPNTVGKPAWASPYAVNETARGRGNPADDFSMALWRISPPTIYGIIDPTGSPIYTDTEPSGTEEWERFVITTDPNKPIPQEADKFNQSIIPGRYLWHIVGLDLHNTVWVHFPYCVSFDDAGCKPVYQETACPRTIGYWKNNFNKIFGDGKGNAQETAESLTKALEILGYISPLYRHGINVQNPQPLPASAGPLTAGEALMILMRKDVTLKDGTQIAYPGGRDQYNSMLARALQQDLAAWLNFSSGKIGEFMYIDLDVNGNPIFQGSLIDGLKTAQSIIFTYGSNMNAPELERAKDIGDQINNGNLGEDAPEGSCETNPAAYAQKIPPDKQPPKNQDLPKQPKRPEPPKPTPETPPDPNTCQGVRVNTYGVQVTSNPFYGIKFNYQSGTEVKDSADDVFKFTLPTDVVNGMTSMQLEAKASTAVGMATLECQFNQPIPCGDPIKDSSGLFAFAFMGATDNGNGTMTLTFRVQNFSQHGLSHASFGLPAGATPDPASGSYQAQVCPGW